MTPFELSVYWVMYIEAFAPEKAVWRFDAFRELMANRPKDYVPQPSYKLSMIKTGDPNG